MTGSLRIESGNEFCLDFCGERETPLLDHGRVYLVREKRNDKALRILQDFDYGGAASLCVSRTHPNFLREMVPGGKMEAIWLSERSGENNISPDSLHKILHRISLFLEEKRNTVIMFDGIEYISLFNEFHKVHMFVEEINDMVMSTGSILLMPVDPEAIDKRSMARLSRFAEVL